MRRSVACALLFPMALVGAGCSLGWRAGVGFSANTEGSVGAQMFAGLHLGARADHHDTLELGTELVGSMRSKPLRLGLGEDVVAGYRHHVDGKGVGWMPGFYLGLRGLFLDGNRTEFREGVSFALLPTISAENDTWKQVGLELQAGYSSLTDEPGRAKPKDDGEFALRLFYDVTTSEKNGL